MKTLRFLPIIVAIFVASCSTEKMGGDFMTGMPEAPGADSAPDEGNGNSMAGVVTAGEWNDLDNWGFWNELMSGQNEGKFYEYLNYWSLYTGDRFAVTVVDASGNAVCGAKVELFVDDSQKAEWTAITDNTGSAELWYNIGSPIDLGVEMTFTAAVDGVKIEKPLNHSVGKVNMNTLVADQVSPRNSADIAFIVDATGSMGDEIDFLKDDLLNIIERASASTTKELRTAALFYRDEGDEYVTKEKDFNTDPKETLKFIQEQAAQGGGDYPEAVHTALEKALQNLTWGENNYARIAFLLLDAPPHYQKDVISSLKKSIQLYAANGIKIIPIAASGIDKNTEFLLRLMAIYTDGTYTFITDHSGVGNDHLEPSISEYQVELLNDLIVRLIQKYTE